MVGRFVSIVSGAILSAAILSTALASDAPMREDGYALAPLSFVKFCIDYPGDCPSQSGGSQVQLTATRFMQLSEVNRAVNDSIIPKPDTSRLRYWRLNVTAGDCNNFAIQKRHDLLALGWPAGALALTVAVTSWGEGHLVVTVRTDQGDLVLDNLRSKIVSWRQTGYRFVMRQSADNPQFWVDLRGGRADQQVAVAPVEDIRPSAELSAARKFEGSDFAESEPSRAPPRHQRISAGDLLVRSEFIGQPIQRVQAIPHRASAASMATIQKADKDRLRIVELAEAIRVELRGEWDRVSALDPTFAQLAASIAQFIAPVETVARERTASPVANLERAFDPTVFGFI
jgi:predicted transglutaminase-like cysteine proteinase